MMKLSRLLLQSRSHFGSSIHAKDSLKLYAFTSQANFSTAIQNYASKGERIFAPYSVFKGKAALSCQPVMPTFAKLESGHHRIERRGVMLLTFMPAVGERKYDYEKRQHFALSATEMGSVMSLGPTDSSEFFHDPSMLSSNAGQVRKSLSIKPISSDGSGGYFVSLSVVNNILKFNDRFNVPLTTAEFTVLKTACSFALPYIMGWDQLIGKLPEGMATNFLKVMAPKPAVADRGRPDLEWDR